MSGLSIPYEVENWNPEGITTVWVKLEELPARGAANLWVYYGGKAAENDPTRVWNENYELVEHFTTDSANGQTRTDSTGKQTGTVEGKGLTALFDYRYLLLNDFMKPKSAAPFLFDAHSFWTGSSV